MQRGMAPVMASSLAHMSGTSPSPSERAAVAGNIEVTSPVAVKRMLTRSSCPIPFRSSMAATRARDPVVELTGGVLIEGRRAPESAQDCSHGRAAYLPFGRRAKGCLRERPHLGGLERPPGARAQRAVRDRPDPVRTSLTTG